MVHDCNVLTAIRTTFCLFLRRLLKSDTNDQTEIDNQRQARRKYKVLLVSYTVNRIFG
jgi:hypothetical protein